MTIAFDRTMAMETPAKTNGDGGASDIQGKQHPGPTEGGAVRAKTGGANVEIASERVAPGPTLTAAAKDPRFHIFVIDSGWNCAASKVLHDHIDILTHLNIDDELYVLDRKTSIAL